MSALDTKFTVSIRGVLKLLFILIFLPGGFLLGRYVFPSDAALFCFSSSPGSEPPADVQAAQNTSAGAVELVKPAAPTGAVTAVKTETSKNETKVVKKNEKIVSSYGKVTLEFTRAPAFEWKGAYGKMSTVYYRVVNGENGAIAPVKFYLHVKGYDNSGRPTKTVDVPDVDKKIFSGETREHGFDAAVSYRDPNVDPKNVEITLELIDEQGAVIATVTKSFDLKG